MKNHQEQDRKEEIYHTILDIAQNSKAQQIKTLQKIIGEDLDNLVNEFFDVIWQYKYDDLKQDSQKRKKLQSALDLLIEKYSQEEK